MGPSDSEPTADIFAQSVENMIVSLVATRAHEQDFKTCMLL